MIERKQIGPTEKYRGHEVKALFLGPDLLCHVDGQQVGDYWMTAEAARAGGRRHIDYVEDEKARKAAR